MTILQLEILLHYGASQSDYRDGDFSSPAVREAINMFRDELGMLETPGRGRCQAYGLTERGRVFVAALKAVPLPVQTWVMPGADAA